MSLSSLTNRAAFGGSISGSTASQLSRLSVQGQGGNIGSKPLEKGDKVAIRSSQLERGLVLIAEVEEEPKDDSVVVVYNAKGQTCRKTLGLASEKLLGRLVDQAQLSRQKQLCAPPTPSSALLNNPTQAMKDLQETQPTKWGITLKQWNEFIDQCKNTDKYEELKRASENGSVSIYDINEQFVKPWTRGKGCGVALLMNPSGLEAEIMLSHAWAEDVEECQQAVNDFCCNQGIIDTQVLWFCTFALYQPEDGAGPKISKQVEMNPFTKVISSELLKKGRMIAVHTSRADLYGRLWCVREVDEALDQKVHVSAAMSQEYRDQVKRRYRNIIKAAGANHDAEEAAGLAVHTAAAKCRPEDEELLFRQVLKHGGFHRIDRVVTDFRREAVFDVIKSELRAEAEQGNRKPLLELARNGDKDKLDLLGDLFREGTADVLDDLFALAIDDDSPGACDVLGQLAAEGYEQANVKLQSLVDKSKPHAINARRILAEKEAQHALDEKHGWQKKAEDWKEACAKADKELELARKKIQRAREDAHSELENRIEMEKTIAAKEHEAARCKLQKEKAFLQLQLKELECKLKEEEVARASVEHRAKKLSIDFHKLESDMEKEKDRRNIAEHERSKRSIDFHGLESRIAEETSALASAEQKAERLSIDIHTLQSDLESEKVARSLAEQEKKKRIIDVHELESKVAEERSARALAERQAKSRSMDFHEMKSRMDQERDARKAAEQRAKQRSMQFHQAQDDVKQLQKDVSEVYRTLHREHADKEAAQWADCLDN